MIVFDLFTVEGQPPREIAHLIKKLAANKCIPHDEDQRLRTGGLKKDMKIRYI